MALSIMESGRTILEMDGAYSRTKKPVTGMQESGKKTENGDMAAKVA